MLFTGEADAPTDKRPERIEIAREIAVVEGKVRAENGIS